MRALQEGLLSRGYRAVPFGLDGKFSSSIERSLGIVWLYADKPIEPTLGLPNQGVPRVHNVALLMYSGPPQKHDPVIWRFYIDHYGVGCQDLLHKRVQKELGIPNQMVIPPQHGHPSYITNYEASARAGGWDTELTVLPHEVVGFAAWLPSWVDALRLRQDEPPPPYRLSRPGPVRTYVWSWAAWTTYQTWQNVLSAAERDGHPTGPGAN